MTSVYTADEEELKRLLGYGQASPEGIIYDWELAGPGGADYYIYPGKHHTKEDIEETREWIGDSFDCLRLYVGEGIGKYPLPREPVIWPPEEKEAAFRDILENGYAPVDDCILVDAFTASAVVQILDAISPKNKKDLLDCRATKIIEITWHLVGKSRDKEKEAKEIQ